jgi:hypothetical protein
VQGGDISNEVSPRLVVVFENLLGLLPTKAHEAKVSTYLKFKRYQRAVNVFELNELLARRIWDVTWRLKFSVDVVTYVGDEFAEAVRERIDREDLPIGHVWHKTPQVLARELAYMPHVAAIYDPNPSHQFTFGSKGRIISPHDPSMNLIGRF